MVFDFYFSLRKRFFANTIVHLQQPEYRLLKREKVPEGETPAVLPLTRPSLAHINRAVEDEEEGQSFSPFCVDSIEREKYYENLFCRASNDEVVEAEDSSDEERSSRGECPDYAAR